MLKHTTLTFIIVLVASTAAVAPRQASAQDYAGVLSGCWLSTDDGGQQLTLHPGGSFMMRGEVGTWTARSDSITFQVTRDLREIWELTLNEDALTLSSPRERRRTAGGDLETPPDRDRRMELRRAPFSECGRIPTFPAPEETDPPTAFVPTPPSIMLTNRLRNDPIEVRLADPSSPIVCEILSQICQPVGADALLFSTEDDNLIMSETGDRSTGTARLWRVAGGDISRGDLTRLGTEPCLPEDEMACSASQGYVIIIFDSANLPVSGWVVLGSPREPAVERAIMTPGVGAVPPVLWVETVRNVRERGESFWQAYTMGYEEETVRLISIAGPFKAGSHVVVSREPAEGGITQVCYDVMRSTPVFDPTNGRVQLFTEVESRSTEARRLVLHWSTEVDRYLATTLTVAEAPAGERVCHPE